MSVCGRCGGILKLCETLDKGKIKYMECQTCFDRTGEVEEAEVITQEQFVEKYCEGKQYDSCKESPCPYASHSGCKHPKHPDNAKPKDDVRCQFCKVIVWENDTCCQCYRDGYIDGWKTAIRELINELPSNELIKGLSGEKIINEIRRIAEVIEKEKEHEEKK
jgi:hypothetical protein